VFAQQTGGQPKWQGRIRSRNLRAMNTYIRPYLDTPTSDATRSSVRANVLSQPLDSKTHIFTARGPTMCGREFAAAV
jgi:hypothetical protein